MAFENPPGRFYNPKSLRKAEVRCRIHSFPGYSLAVGVADAGGGTGSLRLACASPYTPTEAGAWQAVPDLFQRRYSNSGSGLGIWKFLL